MSAKGEPAWRDWRKIAFCAALQPRALKLWAEWISRLCRPGPKVEVGQRRGKKVADVMSTYTR